MTRAEIVTKAREYLGTPFQHQGRLKGHACDCVGLPLMVAEDLGILDRRSNPFTKRDNANYSAQPMDRFVHEEAQRRMLEKPIAYLRPGDVLTLRVPSVPCHTAIVTDLQGGLGIIHAYVGTGRVVEHVLDKKWRARIEGCFEFPGVDRG